MFLQNPKWESHPVLFHPFQMRGLSCKSYFFQSIKVKFYIFFSSFGFWAHLTVFRAYLCPWAQVSFLVGLCRLLLVLRIKPGRTVYRCPVHFTISPASPPPMKISAHPGQQVKVKTDLDKWRCLFNAMWMQEAEKAPKNWPCPSSP